MVVLNDSFNYLFVAFSAIYDFYRNINYNVDEFYRIQVLPTCPTGTNDCSMNTDCPFILTAKINMKRPAFFLV